MDYKTLVAKHYILQVKHVDPRTSKRPFHPYEAFHIECGEGWHDLLDRLCTKIEKELDKDPKDKKDFMITQIKEKFGGLRFYVGGATEIIYNYIDEAERESYTICESCGQPGKVYNEDWVRTNCKECDKQYRERMANRYK